MNQGNRDCARIHDEDKLNRQRHQSGDRKAFVYRVDAVRHSGTSSATLPRRDAPPTASHWGWSRPLADTQFLDHDLFPRFWSNESGLVPKTLLDPVPA